MPKCMNCKKFCRKMYRMGCEGNLVCQKCALESQANSKCHGCYKQLAGNIHFVYYDGIEPEPYHRKCYLSAIQAEPDEIYELKEEGMI